MAGNEQSSIPGQTAAPEPTTSVPADNLDNDQNSSSPDDTQESTESSATVNFGDVLKKMNKEKEKSNTKTPEKEQPQSDSSDSKKESKAKPGSVVKQPQKTEEHQEENENGDTEPTKPFNDLVLEQLSRFKDEESQRQFITDLTNYDKFMASNTKKAQEIADVKKEHDAFVSRLGTEKAITAYNELVKHNEFKEFLEATDGYFEDKDSNPVRKLFDSLADSVPKVQEYTKEQSSLHEQKAELALKEELIDLYELDKSYKGNEKRIEELASVALKEGLSLIQAHKLQAAETATVELQKATETITSLNKKISSLEKELKAKIKRLDEQEKNFTPGAYSSENVDQINFRNNQYIPNDGMDAARQRARERLGVD